ncbi:Casein kinase II regulatory subunit family protein [Trichomonas vaginalis G3]|uniref:Casein kinase II subunit beta n=1 Tax=Trichomonas vaginalis (strain ATCC PRA-98 / G3) TaxID=412133 RepID=A2E6N2_TRIV3|nr:protein kinase regulator protein [Trichomonas vaginalis G3]EAY11737.1 Casein kinase II regulatory subunit family protein [Trichomonas vaginalis G3]KAI5497639.1 protein kinase regulator protein [Trichomonas vaginalis G3]|eukprot:XP_001323960.1 Casein kinase II regulatory subunit family protein [Trichomonas vaginalis G3]
MDTNQSWIDWYLSEPRGKYQVKIDKEYIMNAFNYYGIRQKVNLFSAALELMVKNYYQPINIDEDDKSKQIIIEQQAEMLYGLIHARYLLTNEGLTKMYEKYINGCFPKCPRKLCKGMTCLPYGVSDELNEYSVKLFCPSCKEIYNMPDNSMATVDGAYFGPSWVNLFISKYSSLFKNINIEKYVPKIYGFRIQSQFYENHDEEETLS